MSTRIVKTLAIGFMLAITCFGATYYVSPYGIDSGTGAQDKPFKTIQKAADLVKPGDKVIVKAGVYYEQVTIRTSGTAGSPIVFEGEKGPKGEWLTIVDGSKSTSGWTAATEVGPMVYKTNTIKPEPMCMIAKGDRDIPKFYRISGKYDPFKYLRMSPTATAPGLDGGNVGKYWDGVGALFYFKNGVTYLRFKNGEKPKIMKTRASFGKSGFEINRQSYNTIKGFVIRGSFYGVRITGSTAKYNVVEDNHIMNGKSRIVITGGAAYNKVTGNKMEERGIRDFQRGAYTTSKNPTYALTVRFNIYRRLKREIGDGGDVRIDRAVDMEKAGVGNEISYNDIFDSQAGLYLMTNKAMKIYGNHIHNCDKGIMPNFNMAGIEIYDNRIEDCFFNIRLMDLSCLKTHAGPYDLYIYRNRFSLPGSLGRHIKAHTTSLGTVSPAKVYFYHNSFAGGQTFITNTGKTGQSLKIPNSLFVNNIFSADLLLAYTGILGSFDHNWVGGQFGKWRDSTRAAWFGKNNILRERKKFWADSCVTDFALKPGAEAVDKGIDLSKSFKICGKSFPALPGMKSGYFKGTAPDMGAMELGTTAGIRYQRSTAALPVASNSSHSIKVYNIHGQLVKSLNALSADGTKDLGVGIYFIQMPGMDRRSAMRAIRLR